MELSASSGCGTTLSVTDDGPGVSADDLPKLVHRFYRGEHSRTTPGSGLGLSLAHAVAELHGAHLEIESANPGLRVRFVFSAPMLIRSVPQGS